MPRWSSPPAISRIGISTPDLLAPFGTYNQGTTYADQIKPFNFLDIPHPRTDAPGQPMRVVGPAHPHPRDAASGTYFAKNTTGQTRYRITTARDTEDQHTIHVKTYADVINAYLDHPEAKSLGPDNRECTGASRGILKRRRLQVMGVVEIGKEANNLDHRSAGLPDIGDQAIYRMAREPSGTVRQALRTFTSPQIADAARRGPVPVIAPGVPETTTPKGEPIWARNPGISERTIRDIVVGRTLARSAHQRTLRAAAAALCASRLAGEGIPVPRQAPGSPYIDAPATMRLYLERLELLRRCELPGCAESDARAADSAAKLTRKPPLGTHVSSVRVSRLPWHRRRLAGCD